MGGGERKTEGQWSYKKTENLYTRISIANVQIVHFSLIKTLSSTDFFLFISNKASQDILKTCKYHYQKKQAPHGFHIKMASAVTQS